MVMYVNGGMYIACNQSPVLIEMTKFERLHQQLYHSLFVRAACLSRIPLKEMTCETHNVCPLYQRLSGVLLQHALQLRSRLRILTGVTLPAVASTNYSVHASIDVLMANTVQHAPTLAGCQL